MDETKSWGEIGDTRVNVIGLYIEPFGIGILEGDPSWIRPREIERHRGLARCLFPRPAGLWTADCPEEIDGLFTVVADLRRYEFDDPEYDFSSLRVVAYGDGFPERPLAFLESVLTGVDWRKVAVFGSID